YLLDRIIDVSRCGDWGQATGRMQFGRRNRTLFVACFAFCILGILSLLATGLPVAVIQRAAVVAAALAVHFFVFVMPVVLYRKLPGKEFGVGLFFALGAYACLGNNEAILPLLVSVALLVAFNCLVIAAKDTDSDRANDAGGASLWWPTLKRDLHW